MSSKQVAKSKQSPNEVAVYDPMMIDTLRNSLYAGAKTASVMMVLEYCRHAKFDVMLKPVHIVPMYVIDKETGQGEYRDTIMPGINLYRIQAARSGCVGISEPEFGEDVIECIGGVDMVYPKTCKVTVKRIVAGKVAEYTAVELWKENYATKGKDKKTGLISNAPNAMWQKRPYAQLAKCAEAQALRKGFPEIGSMPTAEEMEGKHIDCEEYENITNRVATKGVSGLKEKLGMNQAPQEPDEPVDFDGETGEVIDAEAFDKMARESKASDGPDVDTVKFLLESATTKKELIRAMQDMKMLTAPERKEVLALYKKRDAELNG